MSDDTTMSIKLSCVKAQHVNYFSQDRAELTIEDSQIDYLAVHGADWRKPIHPLKLIINNYNDKGFRELQISYKDIVVLNLNQEIGKVTIKNATVTDSTASIFGYIDTAFQEL